MAATHTDAPARTNRQGFPIVACSRCGGSGHYSYNAMHGTTCYGCSGTGWAIAAPARKAYTAFVTAQRRMARPTVGDLAVGETVAHLTFKGGPAAEWKVVAGVTVDRTDACGWQTKNGERTETAWTAMLTYADGTVERTSTNSIMARRGKVDPAPFLATIRPARRRG